MFMYILQITSSCTVFKLHVHAHFANQMFVYTLQLACSSTLCTFRVMPYQLVLPEPRATQTVKCAKAIAEQAWCSAPRNFHNVYTNNGFLRSRQGSTYEMPVQLDETHVDCRNSEHVRCAT